MDECPWFARIESINHRQFSLAQLASQSLSFATETGVHAKRFADSNRTISETKV
jgi:hypothetical protein